MYSGAGLAVAWGLTRIAVEMLLTLIESNVHVRVSPTPGTEVQRAMLDRGILLG